MTLASDHSFDVPLPSSNDEPDLTFEVADDGIDTADLAAERPVHAEGRRSDGQPNFEFYALPGRDLVRLIGAMDFECWPDRIVCRIQRQQARYLIEIALFGMVMSLWLERRGTETLHASAVVVGKWAVAFLGRGKGGKTSLAAACVAAGHPLLTDDLLALHLEPDAVLAHRGYPQLRMWPEQARHFVGSEDPHPSFHPAHDKRRVTVGGDFGSFAAADARLGRLYLTERADTSDIEVTMTSLRPREAAMALVRNSFLPREAVRYGLQANRLRSFAELLGRVPVKRLTIPQGLGELPRVVSAVESDIQADSVE